MKIKQKISIILYFAISALLVVGVFLLGDRFISDNTVPVINNTEISPPSTEPLESAEPVLDVDKIENESEVSPIINESDTEIDESVEIIEEIIDEAPVDPIERLAWLFEKNAPLKWTVSENIGENGEAVEEFVKVYPKLAYYYKDISTGNVVTYNADEIMYSASLIKAPYIFAILEEIDNFEKNKHDFDSAGNALYDENGAPLFEGQHPNYDENGKLIYNEGEEKYNLDTVWTYEPTSMYESGSGEIINMPAGTELTWRELVEYTLLYSDNVAFAQLRERFGYSSFYKKVAELGIKGVPSGFMNLSANDCAIFLEEIYKYFETGTENALLMKDCMIRSQHTVMICVHYPSGTVAHKYGWDIGAFHDMAIIYDDEPYLLVILTDYEDGGKDALSFIGDTVAVTKEIHEIIHPETELLETEADE